MPLWDPLPSEWHPPNSYVVALTSATSECDSGEKAFQEEMKVKMKPYEWALIQ
jgi:hypothetical protein